MCVTARCIHRSQTYLFQHTSGTSLHPSVHVGKFRLKAGWHRCRKKLESRNISGGRGGVEVTEVMLRNMLSSTGYLRKDNSCLSESSYCRLYTAMLEEYMQFLKILMEACYATLSTLFYLFRFPVIPYSSNALIKATASLTYSIQPKRANPCAASPKCQMIQSRATP